MQNDTSASTGLAECESSPTTLPCIKKINLIRRIVRSTRCHHLTIRTSLRGAVLV
jgi:hypothetical protein